jgi:hypothetical protein
MQSKQGTREHLQKGRVSITREKKGVKPQTGAGANLASMEHDAGHVVDMSTQSVHLPRLCVCQTPHSVVSLGLGLGFRTLLYLGH